jgi:hypothetical protein
MEVVEGMEVVEEMEVAHLVLILHLRVMQVVEEILEEILAMLEIQVQIQGLLVEMEVVVLLVVEILELAEMHFLLMPKLAVAAADLDSAKEEVLEILDQLMVGDQVVQQISILPHL